MNVIIHKSPVLLAFKIVFLEILVELLYFLVMAVIQTLGQQFGYDVRLLSPLTQLLLLPVQIGILIFMLTKWSSETYEVRDEEIIMRFGVLKRTEKAYPYRNMQSVIIRQSFIERMVGAGTVTVFVPTLGTELLFSEVPNPYQFAESISKAIPDTNSSQFILR